MTDLPHITVIIPTRERGDVLGAALATITAQDYPALTILISDNYSTDRTKEVVEANRDPRIRYINTGSRVSMSHNWEFALGHVEHGWVMVIGDDDGLLPGALRRIAALIATYPGVRAINGDYATFIWPNPMNNQHGRLLVPMGRGAELRSSSKWLHNVMRGAAWYSELPMLYASGVVHTSLLREMRGQDGPVFRSCIPDVYSAVALSMITPQYVWSHEPLAIAGHSRHSNGASWSTDGGANESHGQPDPKKLFLSEKNIPFHPDATPSEAGELPINIDLLVYESYLQSQSLRSHPFAMDAEEVLAMVVGRNVDTERTKAWADRFAAHHGIDVTSIGPSVARERRRLRWHTARDQLAKMMGLYRIEPSFRISMRNVFEASVVADTVLRTRPPRWRSYLSTLRKRLGARPK